MLLTIDISARRADQGDSHVDPDLAMQELLELGYDEIDLTGLGRYRAQLHGGEHVDMMPLRIDDDVRSLLIGFNDLMHILSKGPAAFSDAAHRVYLVNGGFEISARIREHGVKVRVGEFTAPFDVASSEAVTVPLSEYVSLWKAIAGAVRDALSVSPTRS